MPEAPDLSGSPLWRRLPSAERHLWAGRCAALLQPGTAPPPFEAATEVLVDLDRLAQLTTALDLAGLPGVSPQAVRSRQLAQLAGRLCAEAALAAQGLRLDEPLGRDPAGGPLWPAGWTGSITHAAGVAMAAVQRRQGRHDIGLDTEALIVEPATQTAVLARCVHPREQVELQPARQPALLTLLFSAKEAYYKAVRREVARMVDFQEMLMTELQPAEGQFRLIPAAGLVSGLPAARGSYRWIGPRVVTRLAVLADDAGP